MRYNRDEIKQSQAIIDYKYADRYRIEIVEAKRRYGYQNVENGI